MKLLLSILWISTLFLMARNGIGSRSIGSGSIVETSRRTMMNTEERWNAIRKELHKSWPSLMDELKSKIDKNQRDDTWRSMDILVKELGVDKVFDTFCNRYVLR